MCGVPVGDMGADGEGPGQLLTTSESPYITLCSFIGIPLEEWGTSKQQDMWGLANRVYVAAILCPCGSYLVSTWQPSCVHMAAILCPHGSHLVSMWLPSCVHVAATLCPCVGYLVSMWWPSFYLVPGICDRMFG